MQHTKIIQNKIVVSIQTEKNNHWVGEMLRIDFNIS
jgi:hypothetical protein